MSADRRDRLRLALVPGVGPVLTRRLVAHFGTAAAVIGATRAQLAMIEGIGPKSAELIHAGLARSEKLLADEIELIRLHDVRVAMSGEDHYPAEMSVLADPPEVLYYRGELVQTFAKSVAIVGSRRCTAYGIDHARRLGRDLAKAGFGVVSGLALGIDGAAHQGALEGGGWTAAVLAGGLSNVYPPEHVELGRAVAANGCLISENSMTQEPRRGLFHTRNRLISALAKAVVVVEANEGSGALISARHALDQGKEVFALPANVDNPASGGSLQLIRDGARLIRNAEDLLDDLRDLGEAVPDRPMRERVRPNTPKMISRPPKVKPVETPPIVFEAAPAAEPEIADELGRLVWQTLDAPTHADVLIQRLGRPAHAVMVALTMLQVGRHVESKPGNIWART